MRNRNKVANRDRTAGAAELIAHGERKFLALSCNFPNRLDPILFLVLLVCRPILHPQRKENELSVPQQEFVLENAFKHRKVLWANFLIAGAVTWGLLNTKHSDIPMVVQAMMAPAFLTGAAWFGITFGGVPRKLLDVALIITAWMFLAFTASLTVMGVALYFLVNYILVIAYLIIYVSILVSCMLYDNIDGLKVGLDEALLKSSISTYIWHKNLHGIAVDLDDPEKDLTSGVVLQVDED